ncbi:TetR/AcrR family transcriptional regulator [Nocardia sp. CA-135953]|uniref:TetR/AcrR family transcriptional regulator n=1 Tax=Nocardia sp. CA-135953 TaxID=3239978 RepID=UPI003D991F43
MSSEDDSKAPGRPRDPSLDGRILQAAREVYTRYGWSGFTVKAVAATAGASRDAVGRRFGTREELLMEALTASGFPLLEQHDGQPLREWLLELTLAIVDVFTRGPGRAYLRIHLDADHVPGLFAAYRRRVLEPGQQMLREHIAEAAREQNIDDIDPSTVTEDILGPTVLLALLNQDIGGDRNRLADLRAHLSAVVDRALSRHGSIII